MGEFPAGSGPLTLAPRWRAGTDPVLTADVVCIDRWRPGGRRDRNAPARF